jgi:hypothetical protein
VRAVVEVVQVEVERAVSVQEQACPLRRELIIPLLLAAAVRLAALMVMAATATIPYLAPLLQLVEVVEQLMFLCQALQMATTVALVAALHMRLLPPPEFHM